MSLRRRTTTSGYTLPSIHNFPPFFTQQPNPTTQATQTDHWIRLIVSYARARRLFTIRVEDADVKGSGDWYEVMHNPEINHSLSPTYLATIFSTMVNQNSAAWEPQKQTRSVLLYWRRPEEWAEVLHGWVTNTGQINTILTFYEIQEPAVASELQGIPVSLLRKAIAILSKTGRAQLIDGTEEGGVRFFSGTKT